MSRSFILVHGAWHGGWVWRRSAQLLRTEGHDVFTPSLTGLGDRAHLLNPDISLTTHVRDITTLMDSYDLHDVTLCGHSYAGLVVGQVADQMPDRISKIVFLDAFVPVNGKSVLDLSSGHAVRESIEAAVREYGNGQYVPAPPASQFQLSDKADSDWVDRNLGPQPFKTFTEQVCLTGAWRDVARLVYIAGTGSKNPMTDLWDAARADEKIEFREIECGHNIMVDRPEELHAILVE